MDGTSPGLAKGTDHGNRRAVGTGTHLSFTDQ